MPTDTAAAELGKRWASVYCAGCHRENLAGASMLDDPALGRVTSRNLAGGHGGAGATFTEKDWVRANCADPSNTDSILTGA